MKEQLDRGAKLHTSTVELFAYPWDILDRGPEAFVEECLAFGVGKVHAATLYHSGKFLLPHNRTTKVYFPEPGRLFVPVDGGKFPKCLRPKVSLLASSNWLDRLCMSASASGIRLAAWTVFHHSSALAGEHPELAVRNLFGDVYPFALCPSHPAVREYGVALASAIRSLGIFESLDLETIGYLGYSHGYHHEVTAIPVGVLESFLLSLCFCSACCAIGEQNGIAMETLRSELQELLMKKLNSDDSAGRHPENREQLLTLIALSEPLQQLIRVRLKNVSSLVGEIRSAYGGVLSIFSSSFVGSPSNIWMEGVSLPDLRQTTDVFHLLAYSENIDVVNSDVIFCLSQIQDAGRLNLTLNLGIPITPTLGNAQAKIDYAWRQGVRRFAFFNYGLLGDARLKWVQQISQTLRQTEAHS